MNAVEELDASAVVLALPAAVRSAFDVRVVAVTGSTNSDLLRNAATLPSGTVLAAEHQTAGRGRRGRGWHAPPGGGLMFSLLWAFPQGTGALSGLSLAVGLAVARALEAAGAPAIRLKWPNDLLVGRGERFAKLGGILIELAGAANGAAHAVIGIGINVDLRGSAASIDQPATDLRTLGIYQTRNALLALLLEHLLAILRTFERSGFAELSEEWNLRHAHAGRLVTLTAEGRTSVEGIATRVDASGALLLETSHGMQAVVSGEVSLRAAPVLT